MLLQVVCDFAISLFIGFEARFPNRKLIYAFDCIFDICDAIYTHVFEVSCVLIWRYMHRMFAKKTFTYVNFCKNLMYVCDIRDAYINERFHIDIAKHRKLKLIDVRNILYYTIDRCLHLTDVVNAINFFFIIVC